MIGSRLLLAGLLAVLAVLAAAPVSATPPGPGQHFDCTDGGTTSCAADDAGCVPATASDAFCSKRVGIALAQLGKKLARCHKKQAHKAYSLVKSGRTLGTGAEGWFYLRHSGSPVTVPGGSTNLYLDETPPTADPDSATVETQTITAQGTATFTFIAPTFSSDTTLAPFVDVFGVTLSASPPRTKCAQLTATVSRVDSGGGFETLASKVKVGASLSGQSSLGRRFGNITLDVDRLIQAGESIALTIEVSLADCNGNSDVDVSLADDFLNGRTTPHVEFNRIPAFGEEACERDVKDGFQGALDTLQVFYACSPSLLTDVAAYGDTIEASLDAQNGSFYCDSTSGVFIDDGDDAGFVPTTHDHLRCGDLVGTVMLVKLIRKVTVCHRNMAEAFLDGVDFDEEACETAELTAYDTASTRLEDQGLCPPCLDSIARATLGGDALSALDSANGVSYPCP